MADDAQLWTVLGHQAIAGSIPPPSWLDVTRLFALLAHAGGDPADR